MLVVDANEVSSYVESDRRRPSPVLHNAVHNLLAGLKNREDLQIEILYGRRRPEEGEDRWDGNLHFVPVAYDNCPLPGMGGPFFGRALALLRYLRRTRPVQIHAQGTERESGFVAALSRVPSILTLHGNLTEIATSMKARPFSYLGLASRLEKFALSRVSGVHCISRHTQKSVSKRARKTWIIPNAVSPEFFKVINKPSGRPYVVCMSVVSEWKNTILLVRAGDRLHAEFPDCEIHFFGDCNEGHPYGQAFIESLKSRPWCVFHGKSTLETILASLRVATCAVLPSLQENFGLALAEAMAAGVACIGSDAGGIPDVVRHGTTGLLFTSNDEEELSERLLEIHRDPERSAILAAAGREDALRRFTVEAVAAAHAEMYHELASMP
ncbi:glycosyltransferase family 4 protein [Luteolibacter yonseiensis]|uniref:Glycosyltransferase family 4 protein n=1 Tax=Luteolibacter yonseiensis TaxID=1144680 RepID=A0A934R365_9BACT|nr:glycosyltransferase family 4 protein [Luteolibacter yonseiensis]MBK1814399.1 glycosyltransferase family 4 protein [Luteolibacter yonseiensis]